MKAFSIQFIKKELDSRKPEELVSLCIRLAKYKTENKELLNYLLFEAYDEAKFIENIKKEIDNSYLEINRSNLYLVKKSLRKILRFVNRYIKYSGSKPTEVELLIYYAKKLKQSGIPFQESAVLMNLYQRLFFRIQKALLSMHEDLQYDYKKEINMLFEKTENEASL